MPSTTTLSPAATATGRSSRSEPSYQFGRCYVLTRLRQLLVDGETVEIDSMAFDLLLALIARRGALLGNAEILQRLWPSQNRSESCLWILISKLRGALREDGKSVRSVPGQGYVFTADVAVIAAERNGVAHHSTRPASSCVAGSSPTTRPARWPLRPTTRDMPQQDRRTVVIIDDDAGVCDAVSGLLRSVGLQVVAFRSIEQFRRGAASAGVPACLLLDVKLPKENGIDFFETFAGSGIAVPVIFMTAYADIAMSVRAMKIGARDFLTKPVRTDDLLQAVQSAFESAPAHDTPSPHRRPAPGPGTTAPGRSGLAPWQERRSKELMLANLAQDIPLAQVAEQCAMSRSYFSQAFKRSTGLPPHQWLSLQRVIKAKELMLSGMSIADAALACGFSDQSHFTRVFARTVGLPPGSWLRRQRCEAGNEAATRA